MANATLNAKGQVTIPTEVRQALNLQPQDKLNFTVMPDGTVIMRAKTLRLADLAGITGYRRRAIAVSDMKAWR